MDERTKRHKFRVHVRLFFSFPSKSMFFIKAINLMFPYSVLFVSFSNFQFFFDDIQNICRFYPIVQKILLLKNSGVSISFKDFILYFCQVLHFRSSQCFRLCFQFVAAKFHTFTVLAGVVFFHITSHTMTQKARAFFLGFKFSTKNYNIRFIFIKLKQKFMNEFYL